VGNFTIDWNNDWSFCMWANTTSTGFSNMLYSDSGAGNEARFRMTTTGRLQWSSINVLTLGNNASLINNSEYSFFC